MAFEDFPDFVGKADTLGAAEVEGCKLGAAETLGIWLGEEESSELEGTEEVEGMDDGADDVDGDKDTVGDSVLPDLNDLEEDDLLDFVPVAVYSSFRVSKLC